MEGGRQWREEGGEKIKEGGVMVRDNREREKGGKELSGGPILTNPCM